MAPWSYIAASLLLMVTLHVGLVYGQDHMSLTLGEETEEYTVECNEYMYFMVEATDPCNDLRIQVKHVRGEPDLYVSRRPQKYPTLRSLAWSSYEWGSETLTISSWDPEYVVGTYYIGVLSYCGTDVGSGSTPAQFTILAEHVATSHPHDELPTNSQLSDTIDAEDYKYYRFCVPDSCSIVNVTLQNCIDPASCPTSYSWPELIVSRSIERPTINSHSWKLAQIEDRSVVLTHDDPDFYPGHFFVAVYGWCTPDNNCPDFSTCGPCRYVNNTDFTLSLAVTDVIENCTPKGPLELCSGNGVASLSSSATNLILSLMVAFSVKSLY